MRWKIAEIAECECGDTQDDRHLLRCGMIDSECEKIDHFREPNDEVTKPIGYWLEKEYNTAD